MAIGYTYGSEWHLLRYLGWHRNELDRQVEGLIPGEVEVVDWVDFHFRPQADPLILPPVVTAIPRILDAERTGHDFLPPGQLHDIPPEWQVYFPPGRQGAGPQHWDAVGRITVDGAPCWLLVEAKARLAELRSNFGGGATARALIQQAFAQVRGDWCGVPIGNWFGPHYQFCNRVAAVHFLRSRGIDARLLYIYFMGDRFPGNQDGPANEAAWLTGTPKAAGIQQMKDHVGWVQPNNPLWEHVHELFLPVCPMARHVV